MLYDFGEWDELLAVATGVWDRDRTWQAGLMALTYRGLVRLRRGNLADAVSVEEEILSRARKIGDSQVLVPALATAMLIEQARGNASAAAGLVQELQESTHDRSPAFRTLFLADAVRVSIAVGARELAAALLVGVDPSFARQRHSVLTARALMAEATDDPAAALELFDDAAERWAGFGFVLEHGQALVGAGRCLVELRRSGEARTRLEEARDAFAGLGARPLLGEADGLLARLTALTVLIRLSGGASGGRARCPPSSPGGLANRPDRVAIDWEGKHQQAGAKEPNDRTGKQWGGLLDGRKNESEPRGSPIPARGAGRRCVVGRLLHWARKQHAPAPMPHGAFLGDREPRLSGPPQRCTTGQVRVRVTPSTAWILTTTILPSSSIERASTRTITS
jgi:tetratricopeptide (TPR) repeat protein